MNLSRVLLHLLALRKPLDRILLAPARSAFVRPAKRVKTTYRNIVTKFDQNAEKLIVETLSRLYPKVSMIAEESEPSGGLKDGGWTWCVDPLDGTVNYAYGHPLFAVSIALLCGRRAVVGMVHLPRMRETFWAVRGKGTYLNGRPVLVGRARKLRDALLSTGFPYVRNRAFWSNLRVMNRLLPNVRDFRRCGAASVDLAYVACGRLDGYFEAGLSAWDVAAGGLLVEESGGRVTDWRGGAEWIERREILAGNPKIHRSLLGTLRRSVHLACVLFAVAAFAEPPPADPAAQAAPDDQMGVSAIDRADFKIRNLPYASDDGARGMTEMSGEMSGPAASGIEPPSGESILSNVPDDLVIRYLDKADYEKRLGARQMAEKYGMTVPGAARPQGIPSPLSSDSQAIRWLMMSEQEQRAAKLAWFRTAQAGIPLDEFNRVVDLRAYRVISALNAAKSPELRKVDPPKRLTVYEIERLKMPDLRPLGEPPASSEIRMMSEPGKIMITAPRLRPMFSSPDEEPSADQKSAVSSEPATEALPSLYGIPSGLRNGP